MQVFFSSSSANSILYLCCMYQCSFCIPLLASHFYTVLRNRPEPKQLKSNSHQHQAQSADAHTSWKWQLKWVWLNRMWPVSSVVFPPHYLIIKPNSYLAFGSQSAASLMSLPVINLLIVSRSKKVQKERNKKSKMSYSNHRFRGANTRGRELTRTTEV